MTDHLEESLPPLPVAVLLSEHGVPITQAKMDALRLVGRGLGLVATTPDTQTFLDTTEAPDTPRTPAGYAAPLAKLHHAVRTVSDFVDGNRDIGPALYTLAEAALSEPIEAGAAADPDFFDEVARILANSDILNDKLLASRVTYEVFVQHLTHDDYEAATSIINVWERMLQSTAEQEAMPIPEELYQAASMLSELVVFSNHPELEPFLERLTELIQRRNNHKNGGA